MAGQARNRLAGMDGEDKVQGSSPRAQNSEGGRQNQQWTQERLMRQEGTQKARRPGSQVQEKTEIKSIYAAV